MPNHVTNRITAPAKVLAMLIDQKDESGTLGKCVNFGKVIPCPPEIVTDDIVCYVKDWAEIALGLLDLKTPPSNAKLDEMVRSLHLSNSIRLLKEGPFPKDFDDKDFDVFVRLIRAHRAHGKMDWYDWNIANWGTKWGAYQTKIISTTEVMFQTAWSAPHPVIEKLAALNPTADFRHEWADEDLGSNVGIRDYSGGIFEERLLKGTRAGYELAFALGSADAENYELVGGEYKYREE